MTDNAKNLRKSPSGIYQGFRTFVVVAFGQLAASGVTTASVSVDDLEVNSTIIVNPRNALAEGIAYARCPVAGTLVIGLNNAATATVAAQTVTFDVQVIEG